MSSTVLVFWLSVQLQFGLECCNLYSCIARKANNVLERKPRHVISNNVAF